MDKSQGKEGQFGRTDFTWEPEADRYVCPGGNPLERNRRNFKNKRTGITKDNTIIYRARQSDCQHCAMKDKCTPKEWGFRALRSLIPVIAINESSDCDRPSERSDVRVWLVQFSFSGC